MKGITVNRPRSIRLFELLFLGALLLTLVGTALNWSSLVEQAASQAGAVRLSAGALNAIAGFSVGVVILIELALWFFIARRGSTVAKWLLALFTAYNVYSLVGTVQAGAEWSTLPGIISAVALLLQVMAVILLFTPDARAWFADAPEDVA